MGLLCLFKREFIMFSYLGNNGPEELLAEILQTIE